MKRAALTVLVLTAAAVLLNACGQGAIPDKSETSDEMTVVGFSQIGAESDWRNANTISMQEALSAQNGYRLIFDDAQQKQERQITAIRNFINQGVDYIVLAPVTETGWNTVLTEAKTAKIPVIIVDRMIGKGNNSLFTCWVGSDFRREGETAVRWMEENLDFDELNIVHLQGNIGSSAQIGRTESLDTALSEHENWNLVYREPCDFTQAKGQEIMESVIEQGLDFNVIYAENDNMAYGAINALKAAGIRPGKDVAIISFDAGKAALQMILDGDINFDVECNPLHGPRVQAIIEQLENNEVLSKYTYVEETAFDASNLNEEIIKQRPY